MIKKGTVWAKFRTARTSRPTDGRGMIIAIKEAHSQTGYRQSRRKLKTELNGKMTTTSTARLNDTTTTEG
jgi:hypothetical protein